MGNKKRKDITPNEKDIQAKRQTKEKMAVNTPSQQSSMPAMSTPVPCNQGNQTFSLPPVYPYTPTYLNMNTGSPVQQNQQSQPTQQSDILQCILQRLDTVDQKLSQLNSIQNSIINITSRLNSMELKMDEIEKSQRFISEQYDTLSVCTDVNKKNIEHIQNDIKLLNQDNRELRSENQTMKENIIDLKCRSMRDNLMFFGIPEGKTQVKPLPTGLDVNNERNETDGNIHGQNLGHSENVSEESDPVAQDDVACMESTQSVASSSMPENSAVTDTENCEVKVIDFCVKILKIPDAKNKIHIDRAHRVGRFMHGKIRPIVVKFSDTDSKLLVKSALRHINLKYSDYNVSEQFPPEVKEKRKALIPELIKARNQGKRAVLVRDKLYIDNKLFENGSRSHVE